MSLKTGSTFHVIHTHAHPCYCSPSILATMECDWCGKFSQVCVEEREGIQCSGVKSESPVYSTGLQPQSYDLWREYAWQCVETRMCLSADEVKVAVRGQVLILKHGCLSWSKPMVTAAPLVICLGHSHQDWRLESWAHIPPPSLVALGPWGLVSCTGCPVNTKMTFAFLFIFKFQHFLVCCSASPFISKSVSFICLVPLPLKKTAGVLLGCQEKEGPCLFHCLSPSVSCTWINMGWAEFLY